MTSSVVRAVTIFNLCTWKRKILKLFTYYNELFAFKKKSDYERNYIT